MAPIDLYYMPVSTMCNAIIMLAKALKIDLNLIYTDLSKGDQLKPEFVKLNPQHTIPTIVDNGFSLWETRAILTYLVEKYGADDSLYPKDVEKRAVVNQRLYFDLGVLNKSFSDHFYPIMRKEPSNPETMKAIEKTFEFLEVFLEGRKFLAGDFLSVVDFMSGTSIFAYELCGINLDKYTNVKRYLASLDDHLPGFDETKKNLQALKIYFNV